MNGIFTGHKKLLPLSSINFLVPTVVAELKMEFESILQACGGFGRYQWIMLIWFNAVLWVTVPNMGFMMFGGIQPNNECPGNITFPIGSANSTEANCTIKSLFFSIPEEWSLFDSTGQVIVAGITTAQMAGVLVGSIVVGQISDRFGRRRSFLGFFILLAVSGFISSFSPYWQVFLTIRVIIGFAIGGIISVHFVMLVEMLPASKRLILYYGGWPVGFMWLSLLAYLLPHWKWLSLTINLFAPIPLLITIFLVYESPKWLLEKHRYTEAGVVLEKIAKRNGRSQAAMTDLLVHLNDQAKLTDSNKLPSESYHYWHLFRNPTATKESLAMAFSWMVVSAIYYYFLFGTAKLPGNPALNSTLMALGRLAINILLQNLETRIPWLGRRLMQQGGLIAIIIFFLLTFFSQLGGLIVAFPIILTVFSLFGLTFCGPVWISAEMYTAEIFPTAIRNMGKNKEDK